ncbi:glycoside hydrolase family 1 protein [Spiroplasma tabanidicola]|uniref:6-phospho-beta-glucosidase n=1 Tax=Spiroplasma tabanidicola TaxID=324079 RepID=A0A6I6CBB6_9MOLU|nr:glycoside hydrolase family 1 protein [Spiroplasma tabanidicola]QGS51468.1 6-phospho-beta-glucosidase [Spiroplasma tabanidicola]
MYKFKKENFLWGGATAASQVEGAWNLNNKSLTISEMRPFIKNLDRKNIKDVLDISKENYLKSIENKDNLHYPKRFGVDFYHRYKEDIKLFKECHLGIYRLSMAWARIFPNGDDEKPNEAGLKFYRDVFEECKKNNIKIMVTINHFDLPYPIIEKYGGWVNKKVTDLYLKYAVTIFKEFKDIVDYWLPFNEINVAIWSGVTGLGIFREDYKSNKLYLEACYQGLHNQFYAQAKFIEEAKNISHEAKIGCMVANSTNYPLNCDPKNVRECQRLQQIHRFFFYDLMVYGSYPSYINRFFKENNINLEIKKNEMETIKNNKIDFISFSYYATGTISLDESDKTESNLTIAGKNPYLKATDWGWHIDSIGIRITINEIWDKYHLPIFISENGIGVLEKLNEQNTIEDDYRIDYLKEHMIQIGEAIEDGCDVFGYTMWTPIDVVSAGTNEMSKRYGMIYVDYDDFHNGTGNRYLKKSYHWFKKFRETNLL